MNYQQSWLLLNDRPPIQPQRRAITQKSRGSNPGFLRNSVLFHALIRGISSQFKVLTYLHPKT